MSAFTALERFNAGETELSTVFLPVGKLDKLKIAAFQAGFEQGASSVRDEFAKTQADVGLELSRNLQEVAFTHIEARRAILNALHPLIEKMVEIVLPALASEALGDIVSAHLNAIAADLTAGDIVILTAPSNIVPLRAQIAAMRSLPVGFQVVPDDGCSGLQVRIRGARAETNINLDQAIDSVKQGVIAFYKLMEGEAANGS